MTLCCPVLCSRYRVWPGIARSHCLVCPIQELVQARHGISEPSVPVLEDDIEVSVSFLRLWCFGVNMGLLPVSF